MEETADLIEELCDEGDNEWILLFGRPTKF